MLLLGLRVEHAEECRYSRDRVLDCGSDVLTTLVGVLGDPVIAGDLARERAVATANVQLDIVGEGGTRGTAPYASSAVP